MEGRWQRRVHLGPLLAHSRHDQERRHRRHGLRLLSSLARRYSVDAGDEFEQLPFLDFVAAHSAFGIGRGEFQKASTITAGLSTPSGSKNSAFRHALSLGPAAGSRRGRRLAEPRHCRPLRRLLQVVAHALGDRVTDWMLFNEPLRFHLGYLEGVHAPGRQSLLDFLRATHVVNLAQGAGFRALKAARPARASERRSTCQPASRPQFRGRQTGCRAGACHHECLVSRTGAPGALSRSADLSARRLQ